jgi:hypothetical protein
MEFRVFGPVEGVRDGRVILLDSPTQRRHWPSPTR